MKIGYARVSTFDQNMFLQTDALERFGCEKIFTETASGANDLRRGLSEAMDYCRSGDSLCVWKLDRLSRSLRHLIDTVNQLQSKGVEFISFRKVSTLRLPAESLFFMSLAR